MRGTAHLSANYFGDLIKRDRQIGAGTFSEGDRHRQGGYSTTKSIEIAYELGFRYPQHFTRLFEVRRHVMANTGRRTDAATKHYRIQAAATGATQKNRITRAEKARSQWGAMSRKNSTFRRNSRRAISGLIGDGGHQRGDLFGVAEIIP